MTCRSSTAISGFRSMTSRRMSTIGATAPIPRPRFPKMWRKRMKHHSGRGKEDLIPGTFKLKRNPSNDYLIDRQLQRTQSYTGIDGVNTQDFAVQEGMGPIVDRSDEHLGSTDRAIVTLRRMLLDATAAVER